MTIYFYYKILPIHLKSVQNETNLNKVLLYSSTALWFGRFSTLEAAFNRIQILHVHVFP